MSEAQSSADLRMQVWEWIKRHSKATDMPLEYDTPIVESGHLDSVGVLELVFFLEELSGREIDIDELSPESFSDINTINQHFLEPGS